MAEYRFEVVADVNRESGKFASRDEIVEALQEAISGADPGTVDGIGADSDSTYAVDSWEVSEIAKERKPKAEPKGGKLRDKVKLIGDKAAAARQRAIAFDKTIAARLTEEEMAEWLALREVTYDVELWAYRLSSELI